jgi:protein phosphatase
MVKSGEIQKEEMRTHPNKNIITRALGTDDFVRPDCFELKVEEGDVLLLCSDGLTNMVEDYEIENILKKQKENIKLAGEDLVRQANEAGGKDNISVILVRL